MANLSYSFPRETVEFLPLSVLNGTTAVTAYQTAVLPYRVRPTSSDWTPAVTVAGEYGLMISNFAPGTYGIWVRVLGNPESIVVGPSDRDTTGRLVGAGYISIN